MRLERITPNKIRIFLTFDDLDERGLSKEDLWTNVPKVQELLQDMMDEAEDELGFEITGPLAVEVYALKAQGMVVVVSKNTELALQEEEFIDEYIEMQVTVDECNDYLFLFSSIEECIQLAKRLSSLQMNFGSLYFFEGYYYILFQEEDIKMDLDVFISLVVEYGNSSNITSHRLKEYGKLVINNQALETLVHYFS